MADIDLQDIKDTLVAIAFEAGRMMRAANPSNLSISTKLNSVDIVTECDQAVERMVSTQLRSKYPSFAFVGEETYVVGETQITSAPTFIVDPIDGTTNFVHGFPLVCTSLGFALDRIPTVGVVYNPSLDILYTAIRGRGAFMQRNASLTSPAGGQRLPQRLPLIGADAYAAPPPLRGIANSLLAVEWGSTRDGPLFDLKARVFEKLATTPERGGRMAHSLRSLGSAALNLCTVAAGQLDVYWEGGCYAWDVTAGWCILEEAGGLMVGGNPGVWEPALDCRVYLAVRAAPSGQKEVVQEFWDVMGDGRLDYKH